MTGSGKQQPRYSAAEIEAAPAFSTLRTLVDQHGWDLHLIDKVIVVTPPYGDPQKEAKGFDCERDLREVEKALTWVQRKLSSQSR